LLLILICITLSSGIFDPPQPTSQP
jgi:hypothetical protein